jgi:hypothetical protein
MCQKETRKEEGGKREESKQETKRHTQGADPATQADTEHSTGGKSCAGAYTNLELWTGLKGLTWQVNLPTSQEVT